MSGQADPWAHRAEHMRCASCMWFAEKVPATIPKTMDDPIGQRPSVGRCRRHAPSMGGYPVVFRHDWCGDHRLDESKVGAT